MGIGLISYPLYLTHWPILVLNRIAYLNSPSVLEVWGLIGLSILSAYFIYKFIEHPIKKEQISYSTALKIISACFLFCVGSSVYILKTDGAPKRFPQELLNFSYYKYDKQREYREGECFLQPHQPAFAQSCLVLNLHPKQNIFLWGDSFAAHLYPGLKAFGEKNTQFGINQFTASGCPPIINYSIDDRKNCEDLNNKTLSTILKTQPSTLIISANWFYYDRKNNFKKNELDAFYNKFHQTLEILKNKYHGKILIIGQAPLWGTETKRIILRKCFSEKESECLLIILVPDKTIPSTFDDGHFTSEALEFFIEKIKENFN